MFLRCQTQWIYAGDPPAHVGLNLVAVTAVMDAVGIEKHHQADTLARVQVIENEVVKILGRRRRAELAKIRRRQAAGASRGRR